MPSELRWLAVRMRPFLGLQVARLGSIVLVSLLTLLDPLVIKWLIDEILPWRKMEMLPIAALAFVGIFAFRLTFNAAAQMLDFYSSRRVVVAVRLELLRHLQHLSADFHDRQSVGETLHRLQQDVESIARLSGALASIFQVLVITGTTLIIMLLLSWKLTLVIVPLLPVLMYLRREGSPRLQKASDRVQRLAGARTAFLQDHLSAILQIRLLGREARVRRQFLDRERDVLDAELGRRVIEIAMSTGSVLVTITGVALALGYGGYQVLIGALSVGGLVAFYTYLNRLFEPVRSVVELFATTHRTRASIRRIQELLDQAPSIESPPNALRLPADTPGVLRFSDVTFGYRHDAHVLEGTNSTFGPNEIVALVGTSGAGKSTLGALAARLYDPQEGRIEIDGVDLRRLDLHNLRNRLAVVPQDPVLLDASLRENLLLAAPAASKDQLDAAIRIAQLEDVIANLPEGLDQKVGPRGAQLSGGQRQRLALARAVLRDPRILILDESTSALDGTTERRLLDALEPFARERTTLLIAHRLSAVRWADRIVVLDRGRVVEEGTHERLYGAGGVYRQLCEHQMASEEAPGGVWMAEAATA